MNVRVKTRRRLTLLAVASLLLVVLGAGAYAWRLRRINAQLAQGRAEGVAALAAGNYEVALHKIGKYVQRNGHDAEALYQYAQAREQVPEPNGKHIAQAIGTYRQLLALEPARTDARRRLLNLYVDYGFSKEAIDTAQSLNAPDEPAVLRATAKSEARLRNYTKAREESEKYNSKVPTDLAMQRLTLEIMLAQGELATAAVARAEQLQNAHPNDGGFELLLAIAHRLAGDGNAAQTWVRRAASRTAANDPVFVDALVEQLEGLELFDESLRVLTRAAGAGAAENQRLFASRLWQAKRYQEVLDRLKGLDPADKSSDSELLALRAMALFELKRPAEAAPILEALAKRFDGGAEAWAPVLQAVFVTQAPAPKDVIRVCTEALGRAPNSAYFHQFLADAWSAVGEHDHALEHWAKAAQLAPAWAAPRLKVAALLNAAGRPADALPVVRAAQTRASEDFDVLSTLAEALAASLPRQPDGAARAGAEKHLAELGETLTRMDALRPQNESTPVLGTLLLCAQGKRDEAVASARAALEPSLTFADTTYLRLAAVSKAYQLGLDEACRARSEQAHGVTTALAATRARALLAAGKADEGKGVLESARATARDAAGRKAWQAAWAGYLDAAKDPAAQQAWVSLADEASDDASVQAQALHSPSVQSNRDFLKSTIERLRIATGERAVTWRVARARWLAEEAGDDKQKLVGVASLLGEVSRDMPNLAEPRLLLARCLLKLENPREATNQFTRVVNADPGNHAASLELAATLQSQADYAGAKSHLDRVADSANASPQDRATAASLLMRGGDSARALSLMKQLRAASGPDVGEPVPNILLAELYRQNGETQEAKKVCRKILERSPDPAAIGLLADILASEGQPQDAEQVLARLDESKAPAPQKQLLRGRHYATHGDRAKALEQFTAATKAAPANAAAWRLLARHHLQGAELKEAADVAAGAAKSAVTDDGLQALQRVAGLIPAEAPAARALVPLLAAVLDSPGDETAVAEVIESVIDAGKTSPAGGLPARLRQIAAAHPRALAVQNIAARASLGQGTRTGADEALAIASRAMRAFPNAPEPMETATAALRSLNRWDEALGMARQWKRRAPSAAAADLAIATAHLALRQPDQALKQLERYVSRAAAAAAEKPLAEEKPIAAQARILFAQALVALGQAGEAEQLLAGRLPQSPQYRVAWINAASRQLPDHAAAVRWLEAVEPHVPRTAFAEQAALAEGWLALAARSGAAAHQDRAATIVRALASKTMQSAQARPEELLTVAILSEAAADRALAETAYNRSLAADPNNPVAMNNLAMILVDRGEAQAAEKLAAQAATREHPRRASFYDTLATAQVKLKKFTEAAASIREALKLEPTHIGYQIHQAVILANDAGTTRARDALDAVGGVRLEDPRLSNTDRERLKSLRQRAASGS